MAVTVRQSVSTTTAEAGPSLSRNEKFIVPGSQGVNMQEGNWFINHIKEITGL